MYCFILLSFVYLYLSLSKTELFGNRKERKIYFLKGFDSYFSRPICGDVFNRIDYSNALSKNEQIDAIADWLSISVNEIARLALSDKTT